MCRHAKEEWLNNECQLIKKDKTKEPAKLYQGIDNVIGNKTNPHSAVI